MTLIDSTFNSAFISTDEFAVSALFKVDGTGDGVTIEGNFFNEGDTPELNIGEVEESVPMVQALSSDVTGANHNSTFIINSTTYYYTKGIPDGEGMTVVLLSEQKVT